MDEQAALKGVTKEQTASLQTALLHGHIGLVCGPRCEPLSGAEARGSESADADSDGPKGRSSATPRPARLIPIPWTSTRRATKGLVDARCRSDPSTGSGQALSQHLLAGC